MDPLEVEQWCTVAGTDSAAAVVIELPGIWQEVAVKQLVMSLSPHQKAWVMDVRSNSSLTHALVEWKNEIPEHFKSPSIKAVDDQTYSLIHALPVKGGWFQTPKPSPPQTSPPQSPKAGKQKAKESPGSPPATLSAELCAVLGEIVAQCKKDPTDYPMSGYRKLRMFSGRKPVPSGEEGFEEWLDGATQALEEWEVPEHRKKQRITESLKGPALEAIRNLKLSKKDCDAQDYLDILQNVFGGTEKVTELTYQLEHCYQKTGEKLSEFMRRLDKILHKIILKKGIDPRKVDEARVQQVLRGAQPLDPIALALRTRQDGKSLEYPDLIRVVREEEAMLEDKRRNQSVEPTNPPAVVVRTAMTLERDSEVDTLKSQMSQVLGMLTSMMAKDQGVPERESPKKELFPNISAPASLQDWGDVICFNCGGAGHFAKVCSSPKKKKMNNRKPAENFRGPR